MKILILFIALVNLSLGSRILFLFPTPSKSHMIIAHALSKTLAEKGHEVTVVSEFPLNKNITNHREVVVPTNEKSVKLMHFLSTDGSKSVIKTIRNTIGPLIAISEDIIDLKQFQAILNEKFDLLIIGMTFNSFLLGYGDHFKCPTAMLSVQRHMSQTNLAIGNPLAVNVARHNLITEKRFDFVTRLKNFIYHIADLILFEYVEYYQKIAYEKHFPAPHYRSYDESVKNLSLLLVNDNFIDGDVRPNIPAVVEIRGIQVKPIPDKLPENIQKFLDKSLDGAIFFSLGSNVKTDILSDKKMKIIFSVFAKLKQRVIMKWDLEQVDGKPENVLLGKWLPQDDILAHKNLKLFISHCGLGSVVESKYHGVPILAFPIFADQIYNARTVVNEGWAIELDLKTVTEDELYNSINELINNRSYSDIVKKYSRLYQDQPMNARETAVYWIEYVIRHHGAPHLQSPAVHQNFWQRTSLDIVGFLAICILVIFKLFKFIIVKIIRKIFTRKILNHKKLQ